MRTVLSLGCFAATAAATTLECRDCTQTINRDVVIVGGGGSGSHAAVWLRDHGVSVAVVEKSSQLGGHTASYHDPVSGQSINVGVQSWLEYKDSFEFPRRMNVSTSGAMQFTPNENHFIDFKTGKPVPGYVAPDTGAMVAAMQKYIDVCDKYEDMIMPGYFNFPPANKIPEDLLMPFGQFVDKYGLHDAAPQLWDATAQGLGDMMAMPMLFVTQGSGSVMARALTGETVAATPASGRLYELYEAVAEFLGDDVLYRSTVISSKRTRQGVKVKVQGPDGKVTCVNAKRLLITIEPTKENLKPFDLNHRERSILHKWKFSTVYAGILRHPSLPVLNAYTGRTSDAGSFNYTSFPIAPQVGLIQYLGGTEDLFQFTAVGTAEDTAESMKARIAEAIDKLIDAGTIPGPKGVPVEFPAFANHGPMHAHVSADELRRGFIQDLYSLQGSNNMWFSGAAFSVGFSTVLWEYNKVLLPKLIKGL
ncbi:hypothetical protein VTK26DRAFT_3685 [Humicola hyalothermophila]